MIINCLLFSYNRSEGDSIRLKLNKKTWFYPGFFALRKTVILRLVLAILTLFYYHFYWREAPKERRLVEAMGVEPMSALYQASSATCLSFDYT